MPDRNHLTDIQNILGFLIAGFAGVVGFLGLRSTEVSTVLRNDSSKASLIALILLLAVLTAVVSVAVPGYKKVPLPQVVALFLLLLGVGALVIFAVPIGTGLWVPHGIVSLVVGAILVVIAVVIYVWSAISVRKTHRLIPVQFTLVAASVMLLATSLYGAMRLETASQLTSAVQITANITKKASDVALSVHVGGTKFRTTGYVGVSVWGLPSWVFITNDCDSTDQCAENPCQHWQCEFIFGAAFPPDASGNIDETMSNALVLGMYQHIYIVAMPCAAGTGCIIDSKTDPRKTEFGHLDLHIPTR